MNGNATHCLNEQTPIHTHTHTEFHFHHMRLRWHVYTRSDNKWKYPLMQLYEHEDDSTNENLTFYDEQNKWDNYLTF